MTKSTVFAGNYLYHLSTFARLLRKRPYIVRDICYPIWRNASTISCLWWSVFLAICILRSLPILREFLEFGPFCIFQIAHLHYCHIILQCSWRTNSRRVKWTWKKKSWPSRSSPNGSPSVFVDGLHNIKTLQVCSVFSPPLALGNECCSPSQFLFNRRFFPFSKNQWLVN